MKNKITCSTQALLLQLHAHSCALKANFSSSDLVVAYLHFVFLNMIYIYTIHNKRGIIYRGNNS